MTEPRPSVTITTYPAVYRPVTVVTHTLVSRDTPKPPNEPPPPTTIAAEDVFWGEGPPSPEIAAQMKPGDVYVDTLSGNVLLLN